LSQKGEKKLEKTRKQINKKSKYKQPKKDDVSRKKVLGEERLTGQNGTWREGGSRPGRGEICGRRGKKSKKVEKK